MVTLQFYSFWSIQSCPCAAVVVMVLSAADDAFTTLHIDTCRLGFVVHFCEVAYSAITV